LTLGPTQTAMLSQIVELHHKTKAMSTEIYPEEKLLAKIYQPLFDLMSEQHGLTLTRGEMDSIIVATRKVSENIEKQYVLSHSEQTDEPKNPLWKKAFSAENFFDEIEFPKSFSKMTATGIEDNFEHVFSFAEQFHQYMVDNNYVILKPLQ
jgi:hypothetical protein